MVFFKKTDEWKNEIWTDWSGFQNWNLVVYEEANVDEAIPIDIRKEQSTEAYKETMSKDVNNIDTYETWTKVNTKKLRPIYEVIDEAYIKYSKIFSGDFIK